MHYRCPNGGRGEGMFLFKERSSSACHSSGITIWCKDSHCLTLFSGHTENKTDRGRGRKDTLSQPHSLLPPTPSPSCPTRKQTRRQLHARKLPCVWVRMALPAHMTHVYMWPTCHLLLRSVSKWTGETYSIFIENTWPVHGPDVHALYCMCVNILRSSHDYQAEPIIDYDPALCQPGAIRQ